MKRRSHPTRSLTTLALAALLAAAVAAPSPVAAQAPDRAAVQQEPPPPLPERPLDFPDFHETRLPNGMGLIVVEHAGQPVANLSLYLRSGSAADPPEQAGLADMAAELLTKGTETRSATEIAETVERVGGRLNSGAGDDWITVSATVLREHLPLAFDLASDVTLRPTFPEDELGVTRRRALSALQAQLGQPGVIAQRQFVREVYGPEHPYGVSPEPGTIEAITREDLVRFHAERFGPENALLVVSGVVDPDEVEALARRHFGDWDVGEAPAVDLPRPPEVERTRISMVHRPASVQSNIRIGHLGIRPDNPDYFPLLVLNNIVGGGTDARLFQILREEKGWTYGAYSRLTRPADIGYYVAQAEVRTEVTDSALVEMLRQLDRVREEPVPETEFEAAKSYLAGSFPLRIETAGQIAGQVAQTRLLGLPVEYLTEYRERILAVTPEDVRRVAREYIHPDRAAIVIVGDARQVLPMVEGIAPVTLYDVEGRALEREEIEVRAATERLDGERLEPGTRTYQLLVQGNPMGTVTSRLVREGDEWLATGTVESPVMSQESESRFRAADLVPISSRMSMRQGPVSLETELRLVDGRLTGRLDLPEQMGGPRDVDMEVPEGTLLPGMDDYALEVAELAEGRSITLPVFDVTSGTVSNVTYRVTGSESVTVPAGTFDAYRVDVTGGEQPMTLFVRQEAPHVAVRQEYAAMPVVIELESID